jgi:hypothetical protein
MKVVQTRHGPGVLVKEEEELCNTLSRVNSVGIEEKGAKVGVIFRDLFGR